MSRRWGSVGLAVALMLTAGAATGCGDAFFHDPAAPGPVAMELRLELPTLRAGGSAEAYDQVDRVIVRLVEAGSQAAVRTDTVPVDPGGAATTLSLEVTLDRERTFGVEARLQSGGQDVFRGAAPVTLRPGETSGVTLPLEPVAAALDLAGVVLDFQALGDVRPLGGAVLFATGDTLEGRLPGWVSEDPGVVAVRPSLVAGVPDSAVALSEGTARLRAAFQALTGTVDVEVRAEVASVEVAPASPEVEVGGTVQLTAAVRDGQGNLLPGRSVAWTSLNPDVAMVDGQGRVNALSPGLASIRAAAGAVTDEATVRVRAPFPLAVTDPATDVGTSGAVLNGRADPRGVAGTAWFEWGRDPALSEPFRTADVELTPGGGLQPLSEPVVDLVPGATYYVRTVASNERGEVRGEVLAFTTQAPPPAAPTGLSFAVDGGVILRWTDASDDETRFEIERAAVGGSGGTFAQPSPDAALQVDFQLIASVSAGEEEFIDTSPPEGFELRYRVRACSEAGGCSGYSNTVSILYLTAPGVFTLNPTVVSPFFIEVAGLVNPAGLPTRARFVFTLDSPGNDPFESSWVDVGSGFQDLGVDFGFEYGSNDAGRRLYYYIQAENAQGVSDGQVRSVVLPFS